MEVSVILMWLVVTRAYACVKVTELYTVTPQCLSLFQDLL
jgi:hypothetical protein